MPHCIIVISCVLPKMNDTYQDLGQARIRLFRLYLYQTICTAQTSISHNDYGSYNINPDQKLFENDANSTPIVWCPQKLHNALKVGFQMVPHTFSSVQLFLFLLLAMTMVHFSMADVQMEIKTIVF